MTRLAPAVLVVGIVAGCPVPPAAGPLPLGGLPDLVGSWDGSWSGVRVTRLVTEQCEQDGAGILTPGLARGPVSTPVTGRLGTRAGRLALVRLSSSTVSRDRFDSRRSRPTVSQATRRASAAAGTRTW